MPGHKYISLLFFISSVAMAEDDATINKKMDVAIGAKLWNSSWLSYMPQTILAVDQAGNPTIAESFDQVEGEKQWEFIPTLAIKYGNYFFAMSYADYKSTFHANHSVVLTPTGINVYTGRVDRLERTELDVNVGYFILPNLSLNFGVKKANENRSTYLDLTNSDRSLLNNKGTIFILGATGTQSLASGFSAYGQLGCGMGKIKTTLEPMASSSEETTFKSDTNYISTELGIAYSIPFRTQAIRGATLSAGYRSQTIKSDGRSGNYSDQRKLRDVKDGLIFSANAIF